MSNNHHKLKDALIKHMRAMGLTPIDGYYFKWTNATNQLLKKHDFDLLIETLDWVFKRDCKYKPNPPVNMWDVEPLINKYVIAKSRMIPQEDETLNHRGVVGNRVELPNGDVVPFHWTNKKTEGNVTYFYIDEKWYSSNELKML